MFIDYEKFVKKYSFNFKHYLILYTFDEYLHYLCENDDFDKHENMFPIC